MHILKQKGRRWLSGLLAVVILFGLLPASGLILPAQAAGGPPATITLDEFDMETKPYDDNNMVSTNPSYNKKARMRIFWMNVNGQRMPGFCADHSKELDTKPGRATWGNPVPLEEAVAPNGTPYSIIAPYVWYYYSGFYTSEYIKANCNIDPNEANYEDKVGKWAEEHGFGYYAQWSTWTQKLNSAFPQCSAWMVGNGKITTLDSAAMDKVGESYLLAWAAMYKHRYHMTPAQIEKEYPTNYDSGMSAAHRIVESYNNGEYFNQFTDGLKVYVYTPVDGGRFSADKTQPIIVAVRENDTGKPLHAWLKVQKVDQDGQPLSGATFGVYRDSSCSEEVLIDQFTTAAGGTGYFRVDWDPNSSSDTKRTVWVKELQGPSPEYQITQSPVQATVDADVHVDEAHALLVRGGPWKNTVPRPGKSIIRKVDENGIGIGPGTFHFSCLAEGMEFDVDFDESGNLTKELNWWNPALPNYIPEGTYQVTETKGPEGYVIDTSAKEIRLWTEIIDDIKTPKNSGPLTFVNHEKIRITLEKRDESGKGLPGAVFAVYYNDEYLKDVETGADGTFVLTGDGGEGLPDGVYTFIETKAPAGYVLPRNRVQEVVLCAAKDGPKNVILSFTNYRYSEIRIKKVQTGTTSGLAGATFEVKIDEQSIGIVGPTGPDGVIQLDYSMYGKFLDDENKDSWVISVREVTAPDGFMVDDPSWHSQVLHKGETLKEFLFEDEAPTTIIIKKVSANTDEPLAGATFEVEIEGERIGTFGPTKEDGTITIPYARYARFFKDQTRDQWTVRVREITPPAGYLISDKSWHSEVIHRGEKEKQFVFKDAKYPEILIAKKDKETGAYLPNATFDIKIDGTNFQTQKTTNEDGIIRITYDEYGEFLPDIDESGKEWTITVTEVKAPDGYNKDMQGSGDYTQTQRLLFNQSVTEFTFEDTSYRNIKVRKIDAKTGWPLMGAEFRLTSVTLDEGGSYDETQETDESGYAYFEKVPNGTYTLTETRPPVGYDPDVYWTDGKPAVRTVIVSSGDPVWVDFEAKNDPLPGLRIRKVDSVTQQPIKDALFRIEPLAPLQGSVIERTTDGNGEIVLQDLPTGSYRITEISVPKPYIVNSTPQIVAIDNQHDDYTATFPNNAEGILYILKRDAETDEPLAGAWFSITKADGTAVADVGPTGPNGYTSLTGLQPGSYVVKETRAPDGHVIDGESKTFEVKAEDSGKVYVLIFDNHSKPEMWLRKVDANTGVGLEGAK